MVIITINGIDDKAILKYGTFHSLMNIGYFMWVGSKFRKTVNVCAMQREPNMSRVDHEGRSCLHYASIGGHLGCIQLLLDHNAPVHLKDKVYKHSYQLSLRVSIFRPVEEGDGRVFPDPTTFWGHHRFKMFLLYRYVRQQLG